MLVPLIAFIGLYQGFRFGVLSPYKPELNEGWVLLGISTFAVFIWLISSILLIKSIRSIRKEGSLGERLSHYATQIIRWNILISFGMIVLAGGYFISENKWITLAFIASLMLPVFRWPFPKRVCNDLDLKGDERMIVLYRMDSF